MSSTNPLAVDLAGQRVLLLPERLAFWINTGTLVGADLHWGKSECLQAAGIPLPSQALVVDLERLSSAILEHKAKRLLLLGDLVHAIRGLTPLVTKTIEVWRSKHPQVEILVIRGNHDRRLVLPEGWRMQMVEQQFLEAPFCFVHDRESATARAPDSAESSLVTWSGHLHPCITLHHGRERLRLPCFFLQDTDFVLPAFGSVTGSLEVKRRPHDRVFAIAGALVTEVSAAFLPRR